ncbi:hypothetical protein Back2_05800 [Nocardioides baekrokdamisoli]|uniref:Capsule synthesis protein CapA domain-containing protein n=2 Tax=Nocardioides baekrokdamisoli TaxID=1804624 RepID=A0A3G9IVG8_9ACTN|nr:hypothetical protein Back2_05800 [Nocardioides baekrokdamisoli]
MFFGNTYFGRHINEWSQASPLRYAYPFSRLNEFNRKRYDAWFTGLECPTVAGLNLTAAQEEATLTFNCNPAYLKEAAHWFTAFSLANNHSGNQGDPGVEETRRRLGSAGIQYWGDPDPRRLNDICEVVALPVKVRMTDHTTTTGSLPIALCGYAWVFRIPSPESVALMTKYAALMPTIAMPHGGTEYDPKPDQLKTNLYHSMIDAGADAVIDDHPHWVQTSEAYKGRLIVYGMGNFLFDQQHDPERTRSAGINVRLDVDATHYSAAERANLQRWLKLGPTCATYHDDCLASARSEGLTKLKVTYRFGVVGTDDSDRITRPASQELQQSILQRLNWAATIAGLRAPYSGR